MGRLPSPPHAAQAAETTRKPMQRANIPAAKMAPLVRDMAARDTLYLKSSEEVARRHGNGRGHVHDCVDLYLHKRIAQIERRLGITPGFLTERAS